MVHLISEVFVAQGYEKHLMSLNAKVCFKFYYLPVTISLARLSARFDFERYFVPPPEWIGTGHEFGEINCNGEYFYWILISPDGVSREIGQRVFDYQVIPFSLGTSRLSSHVHFDHLMNIYQINGCDYE